MENILVHLNDPYWTIQALHLASALARNTDSRVVLLHLMLARNPSLLGTEIATPPLRAREISQFQKYGSICADYGVDYVLQPMQYVSLIGALHDAIDILDAQALFTKYPASSFATWNKLRTWWLTRVVQATHCQLYVIDESSGSIDWVSEYVSDFA